MVADYRGLDVTQLNDVRTELLKHGARFSVVKNTLAKRAAEEAGVSELSSSCSTGRPRSRSSATATWSRSRRR